MTTYVPPPRWLTCPDCGAMWAGFDVACWACDGEGRPSRSPVLTSQNGFAPPSWDD